MVFDTYHEGKLFPLVMFHYESQRIKDHTDTSCKHVTFQTVAQEKTIIS